MTLLSKNPYSVPREKLNELRVERTWLGGEPYSPQTGSAVSAALRGMFSKNKI